MMCSSGFRFMTENRGPTQTDTLTTSSEALNVSILSITWYQDPNRLTTPQTLMDILSFITGCTLVSLGHCWMVKVPNTVKAVDGSCVEVSCHTAPHHRVIWYQYHSVHYPKLYDGKEPTSVGASFRGRTSVPGNSAEGDCTLRFESVTGRDNNLKLYVWINPDESPTQKFHHQIVTITIENRKAPALSMQNAMVDGALFQANCSVWHSCPSSPPSLHWSRLPVNSTAVTSMEEKEGLWVSTETIQGRGTCQLHKKEMKCTAQFATVQTESQPVILNISYAPVGVNMMADEQPVSEGHSVNVECVADSNPPPGRYVWIRRQGGQSIQTNSTQGKMSYPNISRDSSFSCIVQNNIGSSQSSWLFIDVNFPPAILSDSTCSLKGGILTCVCRAEARPNATLRWTISGSSTLPASFTSITIYRDNTVSAELTGPVESRPNVSCVASNSLATDIQQLPLDTKFTAGQFLPWMLTALAVGSVFLGCVMFVCRRRCRERPKASSNLHTLDIPLRQGDMSESLRYSNPQKPQQKPERTKPKAMPMAIPKEKARTDSRSSVYENDFVPKKPSQNPAKNNEKIKLQDSTKAMCSDMDDIYQNY
ncbi:sialic acid-binding Ig-like lectin 5 isoform X1 [Oncorhynchus tshawytscha]|uniref:Ig-like domain-containing protein n=1 Tax=Oncorhynchus tshawytscha TaxID=74940 RepID=A0A8C8G5R9_ONCTS|nr:sialic acid-binding Ig-like lectin 5 isoform X1 [Oncorhynchus tshawytscha]